MGLSDHDLVLGRYGVLSFIVVQTMVVVSDISCRLSFRIRFPETRGPEDQLRSHDVEEQKRNRMRDAETETGLTLRGPDSYVPY